MKRILGLALCLAACDGGALPEASLAPALGKADSADAADRGCRIVLDSVARLDGPGAAAVGDGASWFVWEGDLRVGAGAAGTPHVLYSGADGQWWNVAASAAAAGRYHFRLDRHTLEAGVSAGALSRFRLLLVPYLETAGGRLFDHNRRPGDFDTYVLDSGNHWSVAADAGVCPAASPRLARVRFTPAFSLEQVGAIVPGGRLELDYALERLTSCRGTHNGYPAWDLTGTVRFQPGGQTSEATVRAFRTVNGTPTTAFDPLPMQVAVPAGARSAEVWFHNFGIDCPDSWDSAYGANYQLEVVAPPAAPAWAGDLGSSFSRDCVHQDGVPDDVQIDEYMMERACMFVEGDVYVPGLTDAAASRPAYVLTQAVWQADGGAEQTAALAFQGPAGHNYRYRWDLPREDMRRLPWTSYRYRLRFSTDGEHWVDAGPARTVTRAFP